MRVDSLPVKAGALARAMVGVERPWVRVRLEAWMTLALRVCGTYQLAEAPVGVVMHCLS